MNYMNLSDKYSIQELGHYLTLWVQRLTADIAENKSDVAVHRLSEITDFLSKLRRYDSFMGLVLTEEQWCTHPDFEGEEWINQRKINNAGYQCITVVDSTRK